MTEPASPDAAEELGQHAVTAAAIVRAVTEAIVIVGEDGRICDANPAATRLFGYPREELIGLTIEALLPERFRATHAVHRTSYFAAPRTRPMGRGLDLSARRRDGTEFPVEISLSFTDGEDGRLAIAFVTDITQRKLAERRLHTEFAVTRALVEAPVIRDAAPRLLRVLCELLGWELGELWLVDRPAEVLRWVGAWHTPAVDGTEFTAFSRRVTFALGAGIPGRAWADAEPLWVPHVTEEACFLRAAPARRIGLHGACAFPVRHQEQVNAVAVFFCRTMQRPAPDVVDLVVDVMSRIGLHIEYRRSQEEIERQRELLHQRETLSALGTLAVGLAHEINNPIGIVSTRIELMLLEAGSTGLPAEFREDLAVLQRNVQRVGRIAQGLLSFARRAPREHDAVDLNRVVEETLLLVEPQMRKAGIEIHTTLDRTLPALVGDMGALQQVVLNLLTNAREAMTGPGDVTVQTRPARGVAGWVQLVIADSGQGIPPEALPRIFDPFFTTKARGTGLGLSLSSGIVEDHGGTIHVASEMGRGTTFVLAFPAQAPAPSEPPTA